MDGLEATACVCLARAGGSEGAGVFVRLGTPSMGLWWWWPTTLVVVLHGAMEAEWPDMSRCDLGKRAGEGKLAHALLLRGRECAAFEAVGPFRGRFGAAAPDGSSAPPNRKLLDSKIAAAAPCLGDWSGQSSRQESVSGS